MCSPLYIYRKIAASCTTRLTRSRSPITGARNRYRRKMRLASESAEEEETRLSRRQSGDRAKRAVQSSQATKNCRGSETAEARERTDRDRRKRRLDSESAKEKDTR